MSIRKASKYLFNTGITFKVYPSNKQKKIIAVNDGISRFIYNRLVAVNRDIYHMEKSSDKVPVYKERIDYLKSTVNSVKSLRNSALFLNDAYVDSLAISNAKVNYDLSWNNFKKNPSSGIPQFHKKGYAKSYQTNAMYHGDVSLKDGSVRFIDKSHIKLPKLGVIQFSGSKKRIDYLFKNYKTIKIGIVTVKMDSVGDYYISLTLSSNESFVDSNKYNVKDNPIAIDVNITNYCTDSNNKVTENSRYFDKSKYKLACKRKSLSRRLENLKENVLPRVKKSDKRKCFEKAKNYQKRRIDVAKLHRSIKNRRKDFLHNLSNYYIKNHDIIIVEDIKPSKMVKDSPLARFINDAAWGTFLNILEYKAKWYNKTFLRVPPEYTSKTCSVCGYVNMNVILGVEDWTCPICHTRHNRDHNASKVILSIGLSMLNLKIN